MKEKYKRSQVNASGILGEQKEFKTWETQGKVKKKQRERKRERERED